MHSSGKTVVLACSSLRDYVEEAQRKVQTAYPVIYLNRIYHRDPAEMRRHILAALAALPEGTDTVLVAMGFCGGSWADVEVPCRFVLPRIDDCVSLLLQTDDTPVSNRKASGHLYVREKDPSKESFRAIFEKLTQTVDNETKKRYHEDWKRLYSGIDIMDTGINGCRKEAYRAAVQADADWLEAGLSYVPAGTYLLEKLFTGRWDAQFCIVEPKGFVSKEQILIGS